MKTPRAISAHSVRLGMAGWRILHLGFPSGSVGGLPYLKPNGYHMLFALIYYPHLRAPTALAGSLSRRRATYAGSPASTARLRL